MLPAVECSSRRVSTYPGSRSMMLWLLVSRRFQLFILCLIAPLVINHLTPELITASIISTGYHNCFHLLSLALSRAEALAAWFISLMVSNPVREYITPQLSSSVSSHPSRFQS